MQIDYLVNSQVSSGWRGDGVNHNLGALMASRAASFPFCRLQESVGRKSCLYLYFQQCFHMAPFSKSLTEAERSQASACAGAEGSHSV